MGKLIRYKHGFGNVIETPSCYVATDEHGTTLGQGLTRYDAEALIDMHYGLINANGKPLTMDPREGPKHAR